MCFCVAVSVSVPAVACLPGCWLFGAAHRQTLKMAFRPLLRAPAATRLMRRPLASPLLRNFSCVGAAVPAVQMHLGFPPVKVDLAKRCAGKKVVLVGLPAAFTPT